ncbi:AAA family ATPase [Streptomyces atratus]|uniref:AAA family ATPase n=1 Tax=Streptomyces atratus TaxID=1893 RepID=UPI0019CDFE37|nr:LuxR family transcriptional regulator [Streptomyces atratus]WPW33048.1 AAA family ATPase [Streptomyces atratus]GGT48597.1 LuxR family transcriptional regulator [Streptomyces atratus]
MALIERETEVQALRAALTDCQAGPARIVLIEGAAGCGKSELVDTLDEWADSGGVLTLRAFGSLAERDLPLGVMRQLAGDAPAGSLPEVSVAADGQPQVSAVREFQTALERLSSSIPLVISVDDLHHADSASLRYLQHIVRHSRSTRMLLVLTAPLHQDGQDAAFGTELLRSRHVRRIRLRRLTPEGSRLVTAGSVAPAPGEDLSAELHAISGGNPLLLRALLEEYRSAPSGARPFRPEPGGLFGQAVLTCLRHSGPHALDVGAALTVLGDSYTPERAGRLLSIPTFTAAQSVASLQASGILDGHLFRHPCTESAVLDQISSEVLADLHLSAAELLHLGGGSLTTVAGHLLATAQRDGSLVATPWAVDVLREATEHLLMNNESTRATDALELAHELSRDEQQKADIKTRLAAITWRINPGRAEKHLSAPLAVLRSGRLASERMAPLAELLAGQGRIAEAAEVRSIILRESGANGAQDNGGRTGYGTVADEVSGPAVTRTEERAGRGDSRTDAETAAQVFLRNTVLTDETLEPVVRALRVLSYSGHPERAAQCCRELIAEAERQNAPAWQSLFSSLLAAVLLRLSDLHAAEEYARRALDCLPEQSSSAFVGAPTATLIRARTLMGDHAAVARQLHQPVADTLFKSIHGLAYLRARGLYLMATHQLDSALGDFLEAGRLAKSWGVDRPSMLPWRTDAAEALFRLGETDQAETLVEQQLADPDARRPWVRGISLRLRAVTSDRRQQLSLLNQSVDELSRSGDRVELARSLADLGRSLRAAAEPIRADAVIRRAWNLAWECGAEALCAEISPELEPEDRMRQRSTAQPQFRSGTDTKLSDSERRVATLAASGYTNREISLRLHITVSTVEQHLTRVYRKLSITRRQDLPVDLQLTVSTAEAV